MCVCVCVCICTYMHSCVADGKDRWFRVMTMCVLIENRVSRMDVYMHLVR